MSEIRALLLTDVVDSTKLSESIGDAAIAEVWAAHDRAARDLLQDHHGREIDKTDGMLLLFEAVADAAAYALAYHRAVAALPVPLVARAGLHLGPVVSCARTSADDIARGAKPLEVDGLAKPIAARIMSLARGGQTLLSADARAALSAEGLLVQSHGHWLIKGIATPLELFEVGESEAAFASPGDGEKGYRVVRSGERWLPAREIPNNLPQQATSFIGRERELDEIKDRLAQTRLLTLLGMGGLGKTRLSLQAAAEVMAEYPGRRLVPRSRAAFAIRRSSSAKRRRCWRSRGARPAARADAVRASAHAARAARPRQLRAPGQAVGGSRPRHPSRRAERPHAGVEPRAAACAG